MIQLIFENEEGVEASILFDAGISESHAAEAFIAEHPVEEGVNISDHIRPKLEELELVVHVTNTPIKAPRNLDTGAADPTVEGENGLVFNFSNQELFTVTHNRIITRAIAAPGPSLNTRIGFDEVQVRAGIGNYVSPAVVVPFTANYGTITRKPINEFDRVRVVYTNLVQHRAQGTIFRVLTSLREYENMVISRVAAPRTIEDGDAITITINMKEVRFAEVEIGNALQPDPVPRRGQRRANNGQRNPNDAGDNNSSFLRSFTDAFYR